MSYIIRNATLIQAGNPYHNKQVDIHIRNGIIQEIDTAISVGGAQEISGEELYVSSGWTDLCTGLTDPGFEHKDDLNGLLNTAASGGFTTIVPLPNSHPKITDKASVSYLVNGAEGHLVSMQPTGVIENPNSPHNLAELYDMFQAGAVAFTNADDALSNGLLKKALLYTKPFGALIISHPLDKTLDHGGMVHESEHTVTTGLKTTPSIAEYICLSQQLEVAQYCDSPIHFSCISAAESVELIRKAKKKGVPVTCDVSIFNLCFTDKQVLSFDENFKVCPPLRSEEDRKALVAGIVDGTIDAISSNHAPQNLEGKAVEFDHAANGVLSQQLVYSWYQKYLSDAISLDQFIASLTMGPKHILGYSQTPIEKGVEADLTIFDAAKQWTFDESTSNSTSTNSHEWGKKQHGQVKGVFNNKLAILNSK